MKKSECQVQILADKSASGRVRPWAQQKLAADYIATAYEWIDEGKSRRIRECAQWLAFTRRGDGTMKLHDARFCRVRLCPICQWRRSLKTYAQMSKVLDVAAADGFQFLFLTLTMRNVCADELSQGLDRLMEGFRRLMQYKRVRGAVKGFYRGCEVTHSQKSDTYHPHLHVILAVKPSYFRGSHYISHADWVSLWSKALGIDYYPIVNIKKCYGGSKSIAEACKYAVKAADILNFDDWEMTVDTLRTLDAALDRRRFIGLGGIFKEIHHKLRLDDMENGDLVHTDGEQQEDPTQEEVIFFWNGYSRSYER